MLQKNSPMLDGSTLLQQALLPQTDADSAEEGPFERWYDASGYAAAAQSTPVAATAPAPATAPATLAAHEDPDRAALVASLAAQSDALPFGSEVGVALERAAEDLHLSGDDAKALIADFDEAFRAHGISGRDAMDLIPIVTTTLRDGPPDEATEGRWEQGINDALVSEFGSQWAANEAAEVARQWVQRDPALVQFLDDTRLGNNGSVVVAVARAAMNARRAGKF